MRRLHRTLITLVLALPAPVYGQAIKQTDLVGSWVMVNDGKERNDSFKGKVVADYLTLNPDGTWITDQKMDGEGWGSWGLGMVDAAFTSFMQANPHKQKGRWTLLPGDSLRVGSPDQYPHKIEIKDQQLFFWTVYQSDKKECAQVLKRFDPSKPLPAPFNTKVCQAVQAGQ